MIWKMSDILILVFTVVLSLNLLIVLLSSSQKFFDRYLDKRHINLLFKFILLYMPILICLISGYILYVSTFRNVLLADSQDFSHYYVLGKETISMSTSLGNCWPIMVVIFVWAIGVINFGVIRYIKDKYFLGKLRKCSFVNKDKKISNLLSAAMVELHVKKNHITVYTNDLILTPFIMGFFKIKLFLPQVDFTEQELDFILKHELVHYKNNDYFFRWWIHYLCTLFWFNPAIYTITNSFLEINEMACDEEVLKNKPKDVRSSYAHLIIQIAEMYLPLNCAVAFTGCTNNSYERRIINIMKKANTNKKMLFLVFTAVSIFICPVTAIAATNGVSNLQNYVSEKIIAKNSTRFEMPPNPGYIECTGVSRSTDTTTPIIKITPRGSSTIDCDISGTEKVITDTINLSQGTKIHFWLTGDNATDKFDAGLIGGSAHTSYVSSSGGEIDYTFTVKKDGDYKVFVKGETNNNIYVSGNVFINN